MTHSNIWKRRGTGSLAVFIGLGWLSHVAADPPPRLNPPRLNPPVAAPALSPPASQPPPRPTPVEPSSSAGGADDVGGATGMAALTPSPEKLGEQATKLLRDLLPREYENRKKWGKTRKVVRGIDIDVDGLKIKTHRRWKQVKDGLWKRYKAKLIDPNERLSLEVIELQQAGPGRVALDVVLVSSLDLKAQLVQYRRNLRLWSLTALADATVKLQLSLELGASLDPTKLPPDIVFDVEIKDAQLDLIQFRLRRLSDIRGGAARQLGKLVEDYAQEELRDQRTRLVEKLNKKIDKQRDHLRFSIQDLLPDAMRSQRDEDNEGDGPQPSPAQPSPSGGP